MQPGAWCLLTCDHLLHAIDTANGVCNNVFVIPKIEYWYLSVWYMLGHIDLSDMQSICTKHVQLLTCHPRSMLFTHKMCVSIHTYFVWLLIWMNDWQYLVVSNAQKLTHMSRRQVEPPSVNIVEWANRYYCWLPNRDGPFVAYYFDVIEKSLITIILVKKSKFSWVSIWILFNIF